MKTLKLMCVLVGVLLLVWPATTADAQSRRPATAPAVAPDVAKIVASGNRFAEALYAKLAQQEGNLFFSPSSIHTALAMTRAGARGETAEQMHTVLALPRERGPREGFQPDGTHISAALVPWKPARLHKAYGDLLGKLKPGAKAGYQLNVANALWGQKGYTWLEDFLAITRDNYGAGLREVDFKTAAEAARLTINRWVEEQTKDKIKDLLSPGVLKPRTRLVLTNAIYFKGDWASQFDAKRTRPAPFKLSADKSVQVPTMNQKGDFGYFEDKDVQVLRLPYSGKDLSMLIYLPRKVDGLAALEKRGFVTSAPKVRRREVIVAIPKFKLTSKFNLNAPLKGMGMADAFVPRNADFSGMNGKKDLFISAVVHKAYVDVNEKGTEAAAATGVVIGVTSVGPPPTVFRADHPFAFVIRHDKTGVILFMGRMANPKG